MNDSQKLDLLLEMVNALALKLDRLDVNVMCGCGWALGNTEGGRRCVNHSCRRYGELIPWRISILPLKTIPSMPKLSQTI